MTEEIKDLMVLKEEIEQEEKMEEASQAEEQVIEKKLPEIKEQKKEQGRTFVSAAVPKEKRKYFRYEDGRVIHMEPNKEKRKAKFWERFLVKEEETVEEGREKTPIRLNSQFVKAGIGVLFLLAMLIVYVMIHGMMTKEEDRIYFPADSPDVAIETPAEETPREESASGDFSFIAENLREINTREREKVRDYIKGMANRGAVISHVEKALSEKEKYYAQIDGKVEYQEMESIIVSSVAMSQEFLGAFQERSVNKALEDVLTRYK